MIRSKVEKQCEKKKIRNVFASAFIYAFECLINYVEAREKTIRANFTERCNKMVQILKEIFSKK